ncbi:MAG TPA: ABC transporter permease [Pseudonocardia sp.]|uniref:ABC transporter permease n=1 Tax=Pseudonocardia sp. TaxID=60912 RepID=UPI002B4B605A|nr:ABC transporter permease [Pseudonocardia sp.]HLU55308.1 ABC transporter permease [Pseudonocardia sp.]
MTAATGTPSPEGGAPIELAGAGGRRGLVRRTLAGRTGAAGAVLVAVVALGALAAALGLLGDPLAQAPAERLSGPSARHWFGTDQFGRDVFARSAAGAAASLQIAVVAVAIAAVVGTAAGVAGAYFRGWSDRTVLGVTNVLFAFPPLLLALALASAFTRTWLTVAVAIAIVYTPIFVRVARGPVLTLREVDFVRATTVLGFSPLRTLVRHVLPGIAPIVIVQVTLSLSWAVLTEASLSFLGLGTPPPAPSLGAMVLEARVLVNVAWWTMAAPGAVIVALVVGLNLLGDGLRDALDPRNGGGR